MTGVVCDKLWKEVVKWDSFARDVIGGQLVRAADSIGANIAESYGRYHYGEKLQFLYYARGSLFETKYWLNRSKARQLLKDDEVEWYANARIFRKLRRTNYGKLSRPKGDAGLDAR